MALGPQSKLYGSALTLATACMPAQFTVMVRDVYGNAVQLDSMPREALGFFVAPVRFTGWHLPSLSRTGQSIPGDVSCSAIELGCNVQYRTTASGRYVILARVQTREGILDVHGSPSEVRVLPGAMTVRLSRAHGQ